MSFKILSRGKLPSQIYTPFIRLCSSQSTPSEPKQPANNSAPTASQDTNVAKYSQADDNKSYKVPEYYQHNDMSYADYEVEMVKYRIPQPSSQS